MFNKVILVGRLTRDIEIRYLQSGSAVANFGIATSRKWRDKQSGEMREDVMFIDVSLFGRQAEVANQYLKRGSKVLVEGRLVFEQWVDNGGQKRSKHKISADSVNFMDSKESNPSNSADNASNNNFNNQQTRNMNQQPTYNDNNNNNYVQNSSYNDTNREQSYNNTSSQNQAPKVPEIDIDDDNVPF